MAISYDEAVAVQRRHERRLLALDGVSAVGVKQTQAGLVLEVTIDPDTPLPEELGQEALDGLPLRIVRGRFTLH
ncbi:MAG TPA: hypothetical protein VFP34_15150 [Microlunatus sp.]|nr:hypothetical protein [Microlunatus sp.]